MAKINRYAKVLKENMIIYEIQEGEDCPEWDDPEEAKAWQWILVGPYAEVGQLVTATGGVGDPPQITVPVEGVPIPPRPPAPEDSKLGQKVAAMLEAGETGATAAPEGGSLYGSAEQPQPEPAEGSSTAPAPADEYP